jgi:alpha-D-ribose 1-methylphosphonate 5-triphosphate diphosphatase
MDHSPGRGEYVTDESFRYYVAKTTGRDNAEIDEIIRTKAQLKASIPERIDYVVQLCRNAHIPIATHDDDTIQKIAMWVEMGIGISEFPTTMEAAAAAHHHGMLVGMGAPNVLRAARVAATSAPMTPSEPGTSIGCVPTITPPP